MILKVDFEKACDNVNWAFLLYMLRRFGFNLRWVRWIEACVCNASLLALVNGSPTAKFLMDKGLRQGDSLSPFLFTLVTEGLALLGKNAVALGAFVGFKLGTAVELHLLQFADDTVLIGEPSWSNLWSIKAILHGFKLVSGLSINLCKSSLMCINGEADFCHAASHI